MTVRQDQVNQPYYLHYLSIAPITSARGSFIAFPNEQKFVAVPYSASSEGKYRFKNDIHFKEFVRSPTTRRSSSGSKTLTPLVTQTASLEVRKEDLLCDYCHQLIQSEFYVRGIFLKVSF